MPRARLTSPVLAAMLACGPELPSTSTDVASTGSTGATASTTAAPTSTATSATTTGTTEALTTAPTSAGSTAGPDTTTDPGSSTGAPAPAQYAAQYYAGGLDRIFVRKADPDADLCAEVAFVWPGEPPPDLTLPAMWGLQWAIVTSGAADCLDFLKPLENGVSGTGVSGTAAWDAMFCPKTLDIDVVATFPQGQPWVPAQVALQAAALPLQGC